MRTPALAAAVLLALAGCGETAPADSPVVNGTAEVREAVPPPPQTDTPRVRLETEAGVIVVELDARRAPVTVANFLAYVDQRRFDGTGFYRAARTRGAPERGFIQGGIRRDARRALPRIAHEPTSLTGLRHGEGAISMTRLEPGTAMGDFIITANGIPSMDAHGDDPGFAAFGRVVDGMDVVRRILAAETVPDAGAGAMRGQMIERPVLITRATRTD
jgi:peptidyl-prolyl cis-trans isomerase A (cyclophilin A)